MQNSEDCENAIKSLLDLVYNEKARLAYINRDVLREILKQNNIECIGHDDYVVDKAYERILQWNNNIDIIINMLRTIKKEDDNDTRQKIIRECIRMIDELF